MFVGIGPGVVYKSTFEQVLAGALMKSGVSHGYESAIINIDQKRDIRFTPDFALGIAKRGKPAVIEVHTEDYFHMAFVWKLFVAKRLEPKFYYVLAMPSTYAGIEQRMLELSGPMSRRSDEERKLGPLEFKSMLSWNGDGTEMDMINSEFNLKLRTRSLKVRDICDQFWGLPIWEVHNYDYYTEVGRTFVEYIEGLKRDAMWDSVAELKRK
ncbi:MAG: hypothetical protein KGH59_00040 [Candidatus Micrarchaeota archaeon]|nr:hypothetical protein [Candidatus Micrarchaeota archaeon]MDE1804163.1 hypothetical protein [Candidatus Micrarchaeota archaeon]